MLPRARLYRPRFKQASAWATVTSVGATLAADAAALTIRSVITTTDPDRAGDVIVPTGLRNRREYLRNPIVLWAHDNKQPPIGTCVRLEVQPDRIIAETKFVADNPFAADLFRLYAQGVLRGWSIGFVPRKAHARRAPMGRKGLYIEEWDLLEYSAVPVPENPAALTLANDDLLAALVA